MRPSKDEHFLRHAVVAAEMATCVRRSVGCVLVDALGHIIGIGYNGPPRGVPHCNEGHPCIGATAPSGTRLEDCFATHAEMNALLQCQDVEKIRTAYCTTAPCTLCLRQLMNTGATRIVFVQDYPNSGECKKRWESVGREWVHADHAENVAGVDVVRAMTEALQLARKQLVVREGHFPTETPVRQIEAALALVGIDFDSEQPETMLNQLRIRPI